MIHEFVDVETILNKQAKAGVDISVISPWSSLFRYDSDVKTCLNVNRIQNDAIAEIVDEYSDKIIGLGMVPMQDAGAAVSELKYCMDIGLRGIEIGTNINGKYLGDADLLSFWSKA